MLKYSVKLVLQTHKPNPSGACPVYIRITVSRKVRYIATGRFIMPKFWDKANEQVKGDPVANADLTHRKQAVVKEIVSGMISGSQVTAGGVKTTLTGANLHNFFSFVDAFIDDVRHKRSAGTIANYQKHALRLELYHGSRDLFFEQIDHGFLAGYEKHLRQTVGNNYIHALFKTMRTFFNAAKKRGIITHYPFSTYETVRYTAPNKDYLTFKELDRLEALADTTRDGVIKQTVIYLLLGCYTGLRISDWYKFGPDNIKDGRLYLRATKNNEWVTMPVVGRLAKHLKRLRVKLEIEEPTINRTLKEVAKLIKTSKHLTSHTGRHTFAITMCAEQGISCETCAELMGITVSTCVDNYYKVTNRKIDAETVKAWR